MLLIGLMLALAGPDLATSSVAASSVSETCDPKVIRDVEITTDNLDVVAHKLSIDVFSTRMQVAVVMSGDGQTETLSYSGAKAGQGYQGLSVSLPALALGKVYDISCQLQDDQLSCHATVHVLTFSVS